jgi:NAD(P)-dependent dehydrogenase (short-subunit alcohol dehydrogenase family)
MDTRRNDSEPMSTPQAQFPNLMGRTALITGAGNGLGRAIALALSRGGARVILVGRTGHTLAAVAEEIGNDVRWMTCDTADPGAVCELGASFTDEDVSILVNNAGIAGPVAALTEIEPCEWDEVFAVNVRGVYLMCRQFLPKMTASGRGDVINIASVSGKRPLARRTPYAASKMAVIALTSTLAFEVGPLGVSVNTLSPGPVGGPRMDRNFALEARALGISEQEAQDAFVSRSALRRMVTEEEVATAVIAMLHMPGLCGADIDLSAGMVAR